MSTKTDAPCPLDTVIIGEATIAVLGVERPTITAKYTVESSSSGCRIGPGYRNQGWSEATLTKMFELLQSMEADVIADVFQAGPPTGGATPDALPPDEEPISL